MILQPTIYLQKILLFVFLCVNTWHKYFAFPEIMFSRIFSLKCIQHIFNLHQSKFTAWSKFCAEIKVVMKIKLSVLCKHRVKGINFLMFYRLYNFCFGLQYDIICWKIYGLNHIYIAYSIQVLNSFVLIKDFIVL